jgi:uncharacterized ubiquitin-like protein YukD
LLSQHYFADSDLTLSDHEQIRQIIVNALHVRGIPFNKITYGIEVHVYTKDRDDDLGWDMPEY